MRKLTSIVHREENLYVSLCPELDIASQGETVEEAQRNLLEAVELFFEVASEKEIERRLLNSEIYVSLWRSRLGKLRVLSGKEVCDILARNGFTKARQSGSHIIMQRTLNDGDTISVPVPNHKEVSAGTLQSIIRQSGLPRALFQS